MGTLFEILFPNSSSTIQSIQVNRVGGKKINHYPAHQECPRNRQRPARKGKHQAHRRGQVAARGGHQWGRTQRCFLGFAPRLNGSEVSAGSQARKIIPNCKTKRLIYHFFIVSLFWQQYQPINKPQGIY